MAASGSSFIPTPLTHADNLGEGHPREAPLHHFTPTAHGSYHHRASTSLNSPLLTWVGGTLWPPDQTHFLRLNSIVWRLGDHMDASGNYWRNLQHHDLCRKRIFREKAGRFCISGNQSSAYVRRRTHEEFHPKCLKPTVKYPTKVMVWGCMSSHGVGRLHIVSGTVKSHGLH
ncbi:hypothetical protein TNCV_1018711 [Trichonephila clavipes]|nr:hypothetical protein TNCV_1018711 [Trichonephila clavipes]